MAGASECEVRRGGRRAGTLPPTWCVGANHRLQRPLVVSSWERARALFVPGLKFVLGSNSKVNTNVPRVTGVGVHLRLGAYNTSVCFYSSFYSQWSASKYKLQSSGIFHFSLMGDEMHSELC